MAYTVPSVSLTSVLVFIMATFIVPISETETARSQSNISPGNSIFQFGVPVGKASQVVTPRSLFISSPVVSDSGPMNKQVATIFALGNRMAR